MLDTVLCRSDIPLGWPEWPSVSLRKLYVGLAGTVCRPQLTFSDLMGSSVDTIRLSAWLHFHVNTSNSELRKPVAGDRPNPTPGSGLPKRCAATITEKMLQNACDLLENVRGTRSEKPYVFIFHNFANINSEK